MGLVPFHSNWEPIQINWFDQQKEVQLSACGSAGMHGLVCSVAVFQGYSCTYCFKL